MGKLVFGIGLGEGFKEELDRVRGPEQSYASVIVDSLNYAIRKRGYAPLNKLQCITEEGYIASKELFEPPTASNFDTGLYMTSFVFTDDAAEKLKTYSKGIDPREDMVWVLDVIKDYLAEKQNPSRPRYSPDTVPGHDVVLH